MAVRAAPYNFGPAARGWLIGCMVLYTLGALVVLIMRSIFSTPYFRNYLEIYDSAPGAIAAAVVLGIIEGVLLVGDCLIIYKLSKRTMRLDYYLKFMAGSCAYWIVNLAVSWLALVYNLFWTGGPAGASLGFTIYLYVIYRRDKKGSCFIDRSCCYIPLTDLPSFCDDAHDGATARSNCRTRRETLRWPDADMKPTGSKDRRHSGKGLPHVPSSVIITMRRSKPT